MASKIKDGNYVVIQSFMVKELELEGNELLIYAFVKVRIKFSMVVYNTSVSGLN